MMDVNSMAERGGNEVWFHRPMKSMVAMEFARTCEVNGDDGVQGSGVVEGGL